MECWLNAGYSSGCWGSSREPTEQTTKFYPSGTLAVSDKENHIGREEEVKFCWSEGH